MQIVFERDCSIDSCTNLNSTSVARYLSDTVQSKSKRESLPNLSGSKIQVLDNSQSLLIRLPFLSANQSDIVINSINNEFGPFNGSGISIDTIGQTLGIRLLTTKCKGKVDYLSSSIGF